MLPADFVEAESRVVKGLCLCEIADIEVHVPDDRARRKALPGPRPFRKLQQLTNVERIDGGD